MLELTSYEMFRSGPEQVTPYLGHIFGQSSSANQSILLSYPHKKHSKPQEITVFRIIQNGMYAYSRSQPS